MASEKHFQVLIFTVQRKSQDNEDQSTQPCDPPIVRTYALMSFNAPIGPGFKHLLARNNIQILAKDSEFCVAENESVEMMEIVIDKANLQAEVSDTSELTLAYDWCLNETMKQLFKNKFCHKIKINSGQPAVDADNMEILRRLSSQTANIAFKSRDGGSFLQYAIERKHFDLAYLLLECRADVNTAQNDGATPLHLAVRKECSGIVELLLRHGAHVNPKMTADSAKDFTPLHIAISQLNSILVQLLLEHGADVDAEAACGSVLFQAIATRNDKIVDIVLSFHPDVNNINYRDRLLVIIVADGLRFFNKLRQYGFKIVSDDAKNSNLLLAMIRLKCIDVVQQLLDWGASPNKLGQSDGEDIAPLHEAAKLGDESLIKLLLDAMAEVNVLSGQKQTPLFYAVNRGVRIVDLLLKNGAQVDIKDSDGKTVLHKAAEEGKTDVFEMLTQNGSDINAKCYKGKTPLFYAAEDGWWKSLFYNQPIGTNFLFDFEHSEITKYYSNGLRSNLICTIVSLGANVNAKCKEGKTALHHVVSKSRFTDLRDLLDCGANIESRDKYGKTPLFVACEEEQLLFVETLLRHGADVDAVCKLGKTPLASTASNRSSSSLNIVVTLLRYDAKLDVGAQADVEAFVGRNHIVFEVILDYCFTNRNFLRKTVVGPVSRGFNSRYSRTVLPRRPRPQQQQPGVPIENFELIHAHHVKKAITTLTAEQLTRLSSKMIVVFPDSLTDYEQKCVKEVEFMKTANVGDTAISLHDVLMFHSRQLARVTNNKSFVEIMLRCGYWIEIPIYASIVSVKFQLAYRRKLLKDRCSMMFSLLCLPFAALPDEVQEKIVDYLNFTDLRKLQVSLVRILDTVTPNAEYDSVSNFGRELFVKCETNPWADASLFRKPKKILPTSDPYGMRDFRFGCTDAFLWLQLPF